MLISKLSSTILCCTSQSDQVERWETAHKSEALDYIKYLLPGCQPAECVVNYGAIWNDLIAVHCSIPCKLSESPAYAN